MSTGTAIVLVAVIVLAIAGGALLWRWAGRQVAARRLAQAAVAERRIFDRARETLRVEQEKSDHEAAETMRRRLMRTRPRP